MEKKLKIKICIEDGIKVVIMLKIEKDVKNKIIEIEDEITRILLFAICIIECIFIQKNFKNTIFTKND